jgi:pyridoxal 5'-phosphate synthase pdxS subunit
MLRCLITLRRLLGVREADIRVRADEGGTWWAEGVCGGGTRDVQGSAMIRTKGEAGTGNVVEAVRHVRAVMGGIRQLQSMDEDEIYVFAKEIRAPLDLVRQTKHLGRLPVVNFAAGGVSTPADAALMMQMGCDGVFVGSGIFKSADPAKRAHAIVQAVTHYNGEKALRGS